MTALKTFDSFLNEDTEILEKNKLRRWIDDCVSGSWSYDPDGRVWVKGTVQIMDGTITEFPVSFSFVELDFIVTNCRNLETLKGSPEKVGGRFDCSFCTKLTTLEGAPKFVNGSFSCQDCKNLTSVMGASPHIGLIFNYKDCHKIPNDERDILREGEELRSMWLASGLPAKDFMVKYRGKIKGGKFGI